MSVLIYLTVNQFTAKHTAFNLGGLRSLIFNEHQNGLAKSGAIVRIGRKLLIREDLFFSWLESQNKVVAK
jgi:predicted DCC family thiol-disulfide oxidoreductase YuxK